MSLCNKFLASKHVRFMTPTSFVQFVQTRGQRGWTKALTSYNPTHHSYYKKYALGRSPIIAKSLAQVLAERNQTDPRISYLVDIGLPPPKLLRLNTGLTDKTSVLLKNRTDPNLEKRARLKELEVCLTEVEKDWEASLMPQAYCETAQHFGIFQDLYGDAFFYPRVPLEVVFNKGTDKSVRVLRGNIIKPSQVSKAPTVNFEAPPDSLWTLILTNPDGNLTEENAEYVHWFIGNIPGNDITKGEVIWDYLQPFPPHGTGYQRLVFVLYKQEEKLDFSSLQKKSPCLDLTQRTFNTYDFYRERQDVMTPAGLRFYQTVWDQSVHSFFHDVLKMEAPRFMYDFPKMYYKPQVWFPENKPFDLYMDRYRDQRDINKRFLIKKLTNINPFEKPPPPLKFPSGQKIARGTPSWLKEQIKKDRMGVGRIKNVL